MIPQAIIKQWQKNVKWQTLGLVEQDLIISRALIELYNHTKISESLIFRGGTALNKLYIRPAARYSEDIDFVLVKKGPVGDIIDAIRSKLDPWLGDPKRKIDDRCVKITYKYESIDGEKSKLKIEINTKEQLIIQDLRHINFSIQSDWFSGNAKVVTYNIDELMATKLRALYQRSKCRDLFDIWYVLSKNLINLDSVVSIFEKYCKYNNQNITRALFEKSMAQKRERVEFNMDMNALLPPEAHWDFDKAFDYVQEKIISKLKGDHWKGKNQ